MGGTRIELVNTLLTIPFCYLILTIVKMKLLGVNMAEEKHRFMEMFLEQFHKEWNVE